MICPKCGCLVITEITTNDDPGRVYFCTECGHQAGPLDFQQFDEPEPEPEPEKTSIWQRLKNKLIR